LVELSKVAAEYNGIYAAHIRYSDYGQAKAWRETMEIGEQAGIPVHISHEHVNDVTSRLLDEADARCDLTFESYMYPAGCTHLAMMIPIWAQAGGPEGIFQKLTFPAIREEIRGHLRNALQAGIDRGARAVFANTGSGRYIGLDIATAAALEGEELGDFALRVLEEERPHPLMVYHQGGTPEYFHERMKRTFSHPKMMVASDGVYHGPHGHPRGYGAFARALRLQRESQAVSLETAVYKMTGFPAERFRIKERGRLVDGYAADVVIFDPAEVSDRSTWDDAWQPATGVEKVIVNGQIAVDQGTPTGLLPGQVI
jgi:N-acyl-D-aspartate/D-glutamate deacylase